MACSGCKCKARQTEYGAVDIHTVNKADWATVQKDKDTKKAVDTGMKAAFPKGPTTEKTACKTKGQECTDCDCIPLDTDKKKGWSAFERDFEVTVITTTKAGAKLELTVAGKVKGRERDQKTRCLPRVDDGQDASYYYFDTGVLVSTAGARRLSAGSLASIARILSNEPKGR